MDKRSEREKSEQTKADRFDNNLDEELEKILNRIDQLPELDNRSPEEIVGYDENGLPTSLTPSTWDAPARDTTDSLKDPDMEDWREAFGNDIPSAVKEFLEYRHREWELGMEADLKARYDAAPKRAKLPKPKI